MNMLHTIANILFLLVFIYLAGGVMYLLIVSIAGLLRAKKIFLPVPEKKSIAVIIPSYKEDNVIIDTAFQAAMHNYPPGKFKVFVIADQLQRETIMKLKAIPVEVIEVKFDTSTKAKSLNAALNQIAPQEFEIVMILDADNVMKEGCLESVNAAFSLGAAAVQCHRTAKNQHTAVAVLDAISEEINNHLFRKGQRALGVSATLIGSGMAFGFNDISSIFNLPHILANPGEDREVDIQLMLNGRVVEYADEAIVFDEKVSSSGVFEKQRVRWLEAQLNHFRRFFQADVQAARKNLNYWSKFIQTVLLPRSLYILTFVCLFMLLILQWIFNLHFVYPSPPYWVVLMSLFVMCLLVAIPRSFYNQRTGRALLHLPVLIMRMLKALFRMKSNRTEFLHTPKTFSS
jgi:cellulose synthase/poly-beta-1,6-N-acetylglucosamine synthase-like glycosyltransferase